MGIMPVDRSRRWNKLFRRYGIPDDIPGTMNEEEDEDKPLDALKKEASRSLFPSVDDNKRRKKK